MKTVTKFTYSAFAAFVPISLVLAFVALAIGASTANAGPGDLIAPSSDGNIVQLPINPSFGTPTLYWDNSNLPRRYWLGIAFDQSGNLYASDAVSETIYKITPDRTTLNVFATGLNGAMGLAVDGAGNIYEADTGSGNVYKFTPQGVQSTFASGLQIGSLNGNTIAMVFDGQGNLFVPSEPQGAIYKITPQGVVSISVVLPYSPMGG
jgi:sugar lactone lactonase YvrE